MKDVQPEADYVAASDSRDEQSSMNGGWQDGLAPVSSCQQKRSAQSIKYAPSHS